MKVAIARARTRSSTLLLDEPTNGLTSSIRGLRELLRGLCAAGKCILFSTHVMQEVSALCDTIGILGRTRHASGTGAELLGQSGGHAGGRIRRAVRFR
jgi:sodium transport system ATP-binding protein